MARKPQTSATVEHDHKPMSKDQLLHTLDAISEEAGNLVREYFAGRVTKRALKKFIVASSFEMLPARATDNAKLVFQALKDAGRPLTIEEWADELRANFHGKSQNMQNVVRANKPLLDTLGAIEEVDAAE